MVDNESRRKFDWRAAGSIFCLVAGVALVLLSVSLPTHVLNRGSWSQQQAEKYQAAAVKLHSLSYASVHPSPDIDPAAQRRELEQAEQDYQAIRSQYDVALARPGKIVWILRGLGIALLAIGGFTAKSLGAIS